MEFEAYDTPTADLEEGSLSLVQKRVGIAPQAGCQASAPLLQQHAEVTNRADRNKLPVRFFGYHPVFSGYRVVRPSNSKTDWVLMNILHDPFFREITGAPNLGQNTSGTLYAPENVIASISDTVNAGIDFDSIFIAHEVPRGSVSAKDSLDLETLIPPPPPKARKQHDFRKWSLVRYWNELLKLTKHTLGIAAKTAAGTMAFAAAAPAAGLDPVLFGVNYDENVVVDGELMGMFYYITHWRWE